METIKIAHLYYDILNLYGESANVLALKKYFEQNKIKVITHFLTIDDEIDFEKYDIFYFGAGNLENITMAANDLLKYKNSLKKIYKDKLFICTGNSQILFGTKFKLLNQEELPMLDLCKYEAVETDFRIVGEVLMKPQYDQQKKVIGFQNHFHVLTNNEEPALFDVEIGTGSHIKVQTEGIHNKNMIATTVLGPAFIRNPYFTEFIIKSELEKRNLPFYGIEDLYAIKAYENTINRKEELN